MNQRIKDKLLLLPDLPGVYKMIDSSGEVIYVGKAINLKNRVRSYFQAQKNMIPRVRRMVFFVDDLEYILTINETEALTLESNLIKEFQPKYNILLKDDKHFPYVRLNIKKTFPRFEIVRRVEEDGAKYLGPYLSSYSLHEAMEAIRDYFPVRHCNKDIEKSVLKAERPCLMYHIKKCCGPCTGNVTAEEYRVLLDQVCSFLEGNTEMLITSLEKEMTEASERMEYEKAAQLRDRIRAIRNIGSKQKAIAPSTVERDVFSLSIESEAAMVYGLFVRRGKIIGTEKFYMNFWEESESELMKSFLTQYYTSSGHVAKEIIVNVAPDEQKTLENWLSDRARRAVKITVPLKGEKKKLSEMAAFNAAETIKRDIQIRNREWERGEGALTKLSGIIGLDYVPTRIECYDNSHMQGRDTVSGMIVFENGSPASKEYRRFKLKSETNGDDYLAMREVLSRRFNRLKAGDEKFGAAPELIIVDGGVGQLNVALRVLEELDIGYIPAIGLAERNEEIILPGSEKIILDKRSPELHFIQRVRDEAHRFAITYHRSLRSKNALFSVLEEIKGLGPKRRKALFDRFITLEAIKNATVEELSAADTITRTVAKEIYSHFHKETAEGKVQDEI